MYSVYYSRNSVYTVATQLNTATEILPVSKLITSFFLQFSSSSNMVFLSITLTLWQDLENHGVRRHCYILADHVTAFQTEYGKFSGYAASSKYGLQTGHSSSWHSDGFRQIPSILAGYGVSEHAWQLVPSAVFLPGQHVRMCQTLPWTTGLYRGRQRMGELVHDIILKIVHDARCDSSRGSSSNGRRGRGYNFGCRSLAQPWVIY